MDNVNGNVEAVGTQFNGSLKVNGKFYNFPKKYDGKKDFKVGDSVSIELKKWEFGGKTGYNIGSVSLANAAKLEVLNPKQEEVKTDTVVVIPNPRPAGRDFDKEARGKTLCQYIQAQLSNPSVDVNDTDGILSRAKLLVEATFNF